MTTPPLGGTREIIESLVSSTGEADPVSAIRQKATRAIDSYVEVFGEPDSMPLDLLALASFLGIKKSDALPAFSPDAELTPDSDGGVEMRVNPDRPETRQRFSIGHEITHTFFPDHSSHVWTRADARYRDLSDPNDYLEMLCDVGAAELVFPRRWFLEDAKTVDDAAKIVGLAARYKASREATVRRYAELHSERVAAIFFSWKLKPTQKGLVGRTDQANIFGITPQEEMDDALRLRIDYAILSHAFSASGSFLPRDKSIENNGPLYQASATGKPTDGDVYLELGRASGNYRVHAIPLWTPASNRGPRGENAIAAILRPRDVKKLKKIARPLAPGLFD